MTPEEADGYAPTKLSLFGGLLVVLVPLALCVALIIRYI